MNQASNVKDQNPSSRDNRKTKQGYVDLKMKSIVELEELVERQNKILLNRWFTQKLPDKGQKIILFKMQLENELKKRQEDNESTCNLFNKLTLNDSEDFEWNQGKLKNNANCTKALDSDDTDVDENDEVVALKLIANHSGTANGSKRILKKSDDLRSGQKLLFFDKFCEKYGSDSKTKERFKPNQFKNNKKDQFIKSAENVKKKLGEKWEVTQATPPVPVFKDTVMISLSESLKLQKQQAEKLKEIEKKNATERLLQTIGVKMGCKLLASNLTEYRTYSENFTETVESNEESANDSENDDKDESF